MHQAAWVNSRNGVSVKDKKQLDKSISKDDISKKKKSRIL